MANKQKQASHLKKYAEAFEKHLSEVDELAQVVLKGHLVIESALNNIISTIFFHPEHILAGRFGFHQKLSICKALCLRKDKLRTWELIEAINTLRNDIAHELEGEKRNSRLERVKQIYKEEGYLTKLNGDNLNDHTLVFYACAACSGFLATYEDDIKALKSYIDTLDSILQLGKASNTHPKDVPSAPQK